MLEMATPRRLAAKDVRRGADAKAISESARLRSSLFAEYA
jgi:hypothetical protein